MKRSGFAWRLLAGISLFVLAASTLKSSNPEDIPPTELTGRVLFGRPNLYAGDLGVGGKLADGTFVQYQASDLPKGTVPNRIRMTTQSAEKVYLRRALKTNLTAGYKYNFVVRVKPHPNNQKHPDLILVNNQIVWDKAVANPQQVSVTQNIVVDCVETGQTQQVMVWENSIRFTYYAKEVDDGYDDFVWFVWNTSGASQFDILHGGVDKPYIQYTRGDSYLGVETRPSYSIEAKPSQADLYFDKKIYTSDIEADTLVPSAYVPVLNQANLVGKNPIWPLIGSTLDEDRLDPDAYKYLADRGINSIYIETPSAGQALDPNDFNAFLDVTQVDSVSGASPIQLFLLKSGKIRVESTQQVDGIALGNSIQDAIDHASNSTSRISLYHPEVDDKEFNRYLGGSKCFQYGDWPELDFQTGTTDVFKEAGELFPNSSLITYLSEVEREFTAYHNDLVNGVYGSNTMSKMGIVPGSFGALAPTTWFFDSIPDVQGTTTDWNAFLITKTIQWQSVDLVMSIARGHGRAFGRTVATRLDLWQNERSTWFRDQIIRAGKVLFFGGSDHIDHESGQAIKYDSGVGDYVPTDRGVGILKIANYVRNHDPLGVVQPSIAVMRGRGGLYGKHMLYQGAIFGNYQNPNIEQYYEDMGLLDIFFTEFGDQNETELYRTMTGSPYGQIDIIPHYDPNFVANANDNFHDNYDLVVMFGVNIMDDLQKDALLNYVKNGGRLVMAAGQLLDDEPYGSRKLSTTGAAFLSALENGTIIPDLKKDANDVLDTIDSAYTSDRNYRLRGFTTGSNATAIEYWSSSNTWWPKAVRYAHPQGTGEVVLLSGETVLDTGEAFVRDLLETYAEDAALVQTDHNDPNPAEAGYIRTFLHEYDYSSPTEDRILSLTVMNQGNLGEANISPYPTTYSGTIKLKRTLFPVGATAADLTVTYQESEGITNPTYTLDETDPTHFLLDIEVNKVSEILITESSN